MAEIGKKREATPETLEKLRTFNAEQSDWTGKCRVCGRKITGKLSDMRCDHGGAPSTADDTYPSCS